MGQLLETKVADIEDEQLIGLIRELEEACRIGSQNFTNLPLLHFLTQCVYPGGPEKRESITTKLTASAPLLESRVGKLPEGSLRDLCGELASLSKNVLEFFSGSKVYMLLNKTLPRFSIPQSTARQRRWDAVIHQRRSNRN
jgi:hypothetical protein